MAKIGLEYVISAKLAETEDGKVSYTDKKAWGPASSFSVTPNANDVKDYGDNRLVEADTSVTNASISVELNENTMELEAYLLGHEIDEETNSMVCKSSDVAPFLGTGCIGQSMRNNKTIYRGYWFPKTQFRDPSNENTTKQESTAFNHSSYEGTAYNLADGTWHMTGEFDTVEEAKAWLDGLASKTA